MKNSLLASCLLFITLSASAPGAVVLISTLGQANVGTAGLPSAYTIIANDFTTGALSTTVTQLTLAIRNGDPSSSYILGQPMIWTDNGSGQPSNGISLGSFDNSITAPAGSPSTNYTFTSSAGITLAPNTTYWLVNWGYGTMPGMAGIDAALGQTANPGGAYSGVAGTQMKASNDLGASWYDTVNITPLYELQGTSVPEPSRMVLLLGGLLGIRFNRRRMRLPAPAPLLE